MSTISKWLLILKTLERRTYEPVSQWMVKIVAQLDAARCSINIQRSLFTCAHVRLAKLAAWVIWVINEKIDRIFRTGDVVWWFLKSLNWSPATFTWSISYLIRYRWRCCTLQFNIYIRLALCRCNEAPCSSMVPFTSAD